MSQPSDEVAAEAANSIKPRVQYADLVPAGVQVLVVDGDPATLAIISTMLRVFGYKGLLLEDGVLTAKSTRDALSIIQERQENLDLILTEIHLPDSDKFEILEKLGRASDLPVIIMTADNNESTMLGALLNGASLYLLKPISKVDIRDLWQFSFMRKRDQMAQVVEDSTDQDSSEEEGDDEPESQLTATGEKRGDGDKEDNDADLQLQKRTKFIWNDELHDKFVQAVQFVGIDKAQPKKILEHMNVPGLRKESVSSHLQKYRLSFQRDLDSLLKMVHPESYSLSSGMHLQELLPFSGSHLQATATTEETSPNLFSVESQYFSDDGTSGEPQSYNIQTSNPIANPLSMLRDELSRSSFRTGVEFTREEAVNTADVLSVVNDSCSIAGTQSSRTEDPPAPKKTAAAAAAVAAQEVEEDDVLGTKKSLLGTTKEGDRLFLQEEVGDTWR